jgi:uncharacterized integral membrane protein
MDENEIHDIEDHFEPIPRQTPGREPFPWGAILLIIWAVVLIVFSVQNAGNATVKFLAWEWRMPVALLVMVTSLVTIVLTALGTAIYRRRRRKLRAMSEEQPSGH